MKRKMSLFFVALAVVTISGWAKEKAPQAGCEWVAHLGSGVRMDFMPIAEGSFQMGSNGGASDERPIHRVTLLKPFWMAKTEVTQVQYREIMGENPSRFKRFEKPVDSVSWKNAMSFCKKLTARERRSGRLPDGFEYVLPTEAQWEYACRAGAEGMYSGDLDLMGWYSSNSGSKTHVVGKMRANALGLHDMHGNVWEWCLDSCYFNNGVKTDTYKSEVLDPVCSDGKNRVQRGGGWYSSASDCRSASRGGWFPSGASIYLGFRPIVQQK